MGPTGIQILGSSVLSVLWTKLGQVKWSECFETFSCGSHSSLWVTHKRLCNVLSSWSLGSFHLVWCCCSLSKMPQHKQSMVIKLQQQTSGLTLNWIRLEQDGLNLLQDHVMVLLKRPATTQQVLCLRKQETIVHPYRIIKKPVPYCFPVSQCVRLRLIIILSWIFVLRTDAKDKHHRLEAKLYLI